MSFLDLSRNVAEHTDNLHNFMYFQYKDEVTDKDIWEIARCYKQVPILGNVYQDILFSRLTSYFIDEVNGETQANLQEEELGCRYYINSVCSELFLANRPVRNEEEYWEAVKDAKAQFGINS